MSNCKRCGLKFKNLIIDNNPIGYQCKSCFSFHNWATGKLLKKEVKKDSKIN